MIAVTKLGSMSAYFASISGGGNGPLNPVAKTVSDFDSSPRVRDAPSIGVGTVTSPEEGSTFGLEGFDDFDPFIGGQSIREVHHRLPQILTHAEPVARQCLSVRGVRGCVLTLVPFSAGLFHIASPARVRWKPKDACSARQDVPQPRPHADVLPRSRHDVRIVC